MPIQLHSGCRARLIQVVAEALRSVTVEKGRFVNIRSCAELSRCDGVIPSHSTNPQGIAQQLSNYIGDDPLWSFFTDRLYQQVPQSLKYDDSLGTTHLNNIPGYENTLNIAERLINDLESLPFRYSIFLRLGEGLSKSLASIVSEAGGCYRISTSLTLVEPSSSFVATYPPRPPDEQPRGLLPPSWDSDALYLQSTHSGYVPQLAINSPPLRRALAEIKTWVGLGIASFLFDADRTTGSPYGIRDETLSEGLIIYQQQSGVWMRIKSHNLPPNASRLMNHMRTRAVKGVSNFDSHCMSSIKIAFRHDEKSRKLRLCAEWLFDSYAAETDLLAFVQSMVTLEILFGDKKQSDVLGIGKLLANRCAYLVGTSYTEREHILSNFEKIYEVRSNIVHGGKTYITGEEWQLLNILRWMCRRAIQKEIELLRNEPSFAGDEKEAHV